MQDQKVFKIFVKDTSTKSQIQGSLRLTVNNLIKFTIEMTEGQVGEASTQMLDSPALMAELRGCKSIGSIDPVNNNGWDPENVQSGETHDMSNVQKCPKTQQFSFGVGTSSYSQGKLKGVVLI